ncbi:signal peptidase II [Mucilaginibacter litoreus]|uniref:Lipoprotein signal peptidase n=1 Tax=Mucilaginibacter litoreus TaxID=1048221 RepID=A0ABW3ARR1_9SPHI
MKLKGVYRTVAILALLAFNISCDQVTKMMMRDHINLYDQYYFFDGHVTLLHVENTGAFLSLGAKLVQPFRFILLTLLPVLALIAGLVYVIRKKDMSPLMAAGIIFCIGGGIGNLYDRIVHGSVTDFLHVKFGALQTGIFNAADVSIMVGLGMILLDGILNSRSKKHTN